MSRSGPFSAEEIADMRAGRWHSAVRVDRFLATIAELQAEVASLTAHLPAVIEAQSDLISEGIGPDLMPLITLMGGKPLTWWPVDPA